MGSLWRALPVTHYCWSTGSVARDAAAQEVGSMSETVCPTTEFEFYCLVMGSHEVLSKTVMYLDLLEGSMLLSLPV